MKIVALTFSKPLIGGLALVGVLAATHGAQAYPYAYASNQITGLTITSSAGPVVPNTFSETISDISSFDALPVSSFANSSRSTATPLTITQAFTGPVAPATAGYTAAGSGTFTGTRSNAAIGSRQVADALSAWRRVRRPDRGDAGRRARAVGGRRETPTAGHAVWATPSGPHRLGNCVALADRAL